MALSEALLLDPYRMDVYIAARTDGVAGSGTQNDPLDGSTQSKFDAIMRAMPVPVTSITYSRGRHNPATRSRFDQRPLLSHRPRRRIGLVNSGLQF
jgi:hypothetical protein